MYRDIFDKYHSRSEESSAKWFQTKNNWPDLEPDIIPMTVADMEYETAVEIRAGLKEYIDNTILGYTIPTLEYKDAIINHYKEVYGVDVDRSEIVPTIGVVTALYNAVEAFTNVGDGVIVFTPVYPQFFGAIEKNNRKLVSCPLIYKEKSYYVDFDLFEELAKDKNNTMLIICSPHNPSGRIWTWEELDRITDIAQENNMLVVADEIHSDITLFGNEMTSYYRLGERVYDNSIVLSSASKSYNIAGLQCAHALIKNEKLKDKFILAMEGFGFHGPNMLGCKATQLAYDKSGQWLEEAKAAIEENFRLTGEFFDKYEGLFEVFDTKATYLAWVNYRNFAEKYKLTSREFYEFVCRSGFVVHPGENFGQEGAFFMRINVAMPRHKYMENLQRRARGLKDKFDI